MREKCVTTMNFMEPGILSIGQVSQKVKTMLFGSSWACSTVRNFNAVAIAISQCFAICPVADLQRLFLLYHSLEYIADGRWKRIRIFKMLEYTDDWISFQSIHCYAFIMYVKVEFIHRDSVKNKISIVHV